MNSGRTGSFLAAFAGAALSTAAFAQPFAMVDLGLLPGDGAIAPATNSQQDHAIAQGGDQHLVVWSDYRSQNVGNATNQSAGDIFGIRLDSSGQPIDDAPFVICADMGEQRRPKVAWNGEQWLVVFESQEPVGGYFGTRVRAVRVTAQGEVLDTPEFMLPLSQFEPSTIGLNVAGQQGEWLIARCMYHDDGYGTFLAGQRLGADGVLIDQQPKMLMDWIYGGLTVLAGDGEYLVAGPTWNDGSQFQARRVSLDAQPLGAPFSVPGPTIAAGGGEYYVAWEKDFVNLVGSRMTSAGVLLTPAGTMLVEGFTQYHERSLTHDGSRWWLEWSAGEDIRTLRIAADGTVQDPLGGIELPITIGGNVNTAYAPIMSPRSGGGVHVLWYDLRVAYNYDTNVFLIPVSADNTPEAERCVSTGTASQRMPDMAAGPDGDTAVAFVSEFANDDRVLVHLLDAAGQPRFTEPVEVFRGPTVGRASVAWNGSVYLVTWDAGTIKARRMDADGNLLDAAPLEVMPGFGPDVEALGDDFLVATTRYGTYPQFIDVWCRRIDGSTGTTLDAGPFVVGGGYAQAVRVRTDGTRWVVVYHSHWTHDSSQSDAVYNFVNANGTFTPMLNPATTSGAAGTPDVAFSGNKYLFVWRNNSLSNANNYIAGRLMNADGSFATGNFTIAEAPGRQLRPVVSWDGESFIVAWDDQRNQESFFDERTDTYATRISESGAVLDNPAFAVSTGPDGEATVSILSHADGRTFVANARFSLESPFDTYRVGVMRVGPTPCPGDANHDGTVNFDDLNEILAHWGESGAQAANADMAPAPFGDGVVDYGDLNLLLSAWAMPCP